MRRKTKQTETHQVVLTRPDGSQFSTIRTQAIGTQSHRLDNDSDVVGALAILMQLMLNDASNNHFEKFSNTRTPGDKSHNIKPVPYYMPSEVWKLILSFNLIPGVTYVKPSIPKGIAGPEIPWLDQTEQTGAVAICLNKSSLFPAINMHPDSIIEAVLHGDEEMIMRIVAADPRYLTKIGTAKDPSGEPFTGTLLQAALRTTDMQLCEKIKPYFGKIENGEMEMHRQIKTIYTKSLNRYLNIQSAVLKEQEAKQLELLELTNLNTAQKKQYEEIEEKIKQTTRSIIICKTALKQDDIHKIIEAYNQAQEHNAFDFQPYVDAICAIDLNDPLQKKLLDDVMALINAKTSEKTAEVIARTGVAATQTDEARAKPFDLLTLVEKLNRFREEFVKHMQQEIIFNPHHILTGLKHNEKTWDDVGAHHIADPNYEKRTVIFSQLVGWAQRKAAEPVKQDIRQGTYYLTTENETRSRPVRFNDWDVHNSKILRNSLVDTSLVDSTSFDGVGFKFGGGHGVGLLRGEMRDGFSKLMSSKNIGLGKLMQPAKSCQSHKRPVCAMM